ncbi:MAG TPA: hypothetical protein VKQ36_02680, partial [Ktedonobacterales bacterium]|nr:hypothetical protein [Ktedonobacterales bacterium]
MPGVNGASPASLQSSRQTRTLRAKTFGQPLALTLAEARGLALAAQGLFDPSPATPTLADVRALFDRLGV